MGAKASTANGGGTSPRARTFSTSSNSDVVAEDTGFSLLRAIPGAVSSDRQRARSLSSVPDSHSSHEAIGIPNSNVGAYDISESPETDSSSTEDHVLDSPLAANISLGRVYTAHSLPSHIWSLNGEYVFDALFLNTVLTVDKLKGSLLLCVVSGNLTLYYPYSFIFAS